MDWLSEDSASASTSSDDDDYEEEEEKVVNEDDNEKNDTKEKQKTQQSEVQVFTSSQRPRGTVILLSMDQAPANLFERMVPHRRGHWSGHVFIPVNSSHSCIQSSSSAVRQSIQCFQSVLEQQGYSGTIVEHSQLHLSLSRFFSLQLAFLDSFVTKLQQRLAMEHATRSFVERRQGTILVNDDKTRSFWCWKIPSPNQSLLRILHHVDSIMKEYGQPVYYDPPTFHISLASFDGNLEGLTTLVQDHDNKGNQHSNNHEPTDNDDLVVVDDHDDDDTLAFLEIDQVVCEFGTTKQYTIPLTPS